MTKKEIEVAKDVILDFKKYIKDLELFNEVDRAYLEGGIRTLEWFLWRFKYLSEDELSEINN